MSKKGIRLQYGGFIIFGGQLIGVVTGLIFTLLLTRSMTLAQYGIWTNIFDYIAYFNLFSGLLPFWATRFVAREKEGTIKTSTLAQLMMALVLMSVYFPAIVLISRAIGTQVYLLIYLISGFYILAFYMINIFENILQPIKPQALGYGFLIEETVKVTVALVLILGFKQLFLGAILALVLSCFVQISYYVWLLREKFTEKINWEYLKEWFKGSLAIAYNAIGNQLMTFALILLFLYGGPDTRAYYQGAASFTVIIGYSISLSIVLYPKLLSNSCTDEQVGTSFRTVMMLAIPLATITMVMSFSFLTVLKAAYGVAWPVLIALSIDTIINLLTSFYSNCVMGVERFDAEGKISIRQLVRSKIFQVFTIPYIQAAIALPLAYFVLTRLPIAGSVQAALYIVGILIAVHLSTFIGLYWFMHHSIKIPVAWMSIAKFVFAAILMTGILLLIPTTSTLLSTIAKAIGGFGIYVIILLAIDNQARKLVRLIWEEIKGSIAQLTYKGNNGDNGNELSGKNGLNATQD